MTAATSGVLSGLRSRLFLGLAVCLLPFGAAGAEPAVQARLASESLLLDGASAGSRLVVVGARGHVLVSDDGGLKWKQARVPVRALLTAVHMHDKRVGWAVGHDAVILRTGDGGATWSVAHYAPKEERPLLDVWFRDERNGFAVGAYGYFLATSDGGRTWKPRTIDKDDFHLNAIVPAGAGRLFIAGEAGAIYRSDDGGSTWRKLPSPYAGSWFSALALDADGLLLFGLRGSMYRSGDGGRELDAGAHADEGDSHRSAPREAGSVARHRPRRRAARQPRRRAERFDRRSVQTPDLPPGNLEGARAFRWAGAAARRVRGQAPARGPIGSFPCRTPPPLPRHPR